MASGSVNKVILVGNLGRDAELRATPGGLEVISFSVATTERKRDKDTNQWTDQVEWHRVKMFRDTQRSRSTVHEYLKKGQVNADNLVLQQFVLGQGTLFLITQTLKAKRITVKSENENGTEVKVDVPVIKGIASGKVNVESSADQSSLVTYSGDKSIVFGFQAFRVGVAGGVLSLVPAAPGSVSFGVTF